MFTTEQEAEEALKLKRIQLNGFNGVCCDVTTFKSGNRKIYISPLALPEEVIRPYFESNYGCILRYEILPGRTAAFILFLKVDSAVACRNKHHCINGINVFARPGYLPGPTFKYDISESMYRVTPSISVAYDYNGYSSLHNSPQYRDSPFQSPNRIDSHSFQTELPPSSGLSSSHSEIVHADSSFASYLADTFPKFRPLLKELEDLSIAEIDEKRKRKKKVVDNEEMILKWRSTHVESNKGTIEPVVDEKELRCDEIRESCNRPPIIVGAHYARDNEGLPIHYNGNYIHSIFKDGRFRFKVYKHVTFDTSKNTVKLFERAAEEYEFFGPRNPCKAENRLIRCDEDDIEGWEDESEISNFTYKNTEGFPHHLKWPFDFPAKPRHIPLMDKSTYEDNTSLDINLAVRYMDHLVERWQNANQHKFISTFTPFLREYCSVCEVKLDKPTMRFDHIFSRAHLVNLNRNNVKYCLSDFTFWNNVLIYNFKMGKRKSRGRGRTSR
ncbi:hypothetical protein PRIPAC_87319 [Pristionchus pacificus]|nr:hypothetical protein PRIPAC_87319 [Pristionchus pacificus]